MAKTFYLIRHGATEGSDTRRYKGSIDVPLSQEGIEQIKRVADFFASSGINSFSLYCSPLARALKSAEIIGEPFRISPTVLPELRERSFGVWEGLTFSEIAERYPEEFRAWKDNPLKYSPPEGESTVDVRDRVMKAINEIVYNGKDGNTVIVAHGGVNRIILCEFLGIPLENIFRIEQDYGCINIIEIHDGYPVVKGLNWRTIGSGLRI